MNEREKIEAEYREATDALHVARLRFGRAIKGADDPDARSVWVEAKIRHNKAKAALRDLDHTPPS